MGIKKCKYCGNELNIKRGKGQLKHFCNESHKSAYYSELRNERFNRLNPDKFIKKELEGNVEIKKRKYIDEIEINKVIGKCGVFTFRIDSALIRKLELRGGDVVKIAIKVVYREPRI